MNIKTLLGCFALLGLNAGLLPGQDTRLFTEPPQIVDIGPDHRVVLTVEQTTDPSGIRRDLTNSYVELASGMHYLADDGNWLESREEIEIIGDHALARQGPHNVIFAGNLNTPGSIDMQTPGGERFISHVLGLNYYDAATGQSVLIARVKGSIGAVLGNQVFYEDAFQGEEGAEGLRATVRYTYRRDSLEQDVILETQLPDPQWFGMNPDSVRLEVITEFLEAPEPAQEERLVGSVQDPALRAGMIEPDLVDNLLEFADSRIGRGLAFSVGLEEAVQGMAAAPVMVAKSWAVLEGRTLLIESVPFPELEPLLERLEARLPMPRQNEERLHARVAGIRELPVPSGGDADSKEMQVASVAPVRQGVLIDYVQTVSSTSNMRFYNNTTYYVAGTVNLTGTTVFEGGTVIKYTNTLSAKINITGPVVCLTDPYRPVAFVSKNDNSIGDTVAGSTGTPATYGSAMYLDSYTGGYSYNLKNLRINHASNGLTFFGAGYSHTLTDAQFVNCATAVTTYYCELALRNALAHSVGTVFSMPGSTIRAEHLTAHVAGNLRSGSPSGTLYSTNGLMVSVTNNGSWYSGTGNATISSSSGVFQTVGNGSHYLAAGSVHRNAGTTNIHSTLSAAFKSKTTHPPVVIQANGYLGQSYDLGPVVQRDTDIPDRGWHYDALDYALGYSYLTNATITVAPGTAIATFGSGGGTYGLAVAEGARFLCEGTAASPVYIVHHTTVQEQATNQWGKASSGSIMTPWTSVSPPPELKFRFTRWSAMATEIAHMQPYTYQSGMPPVAVVDCEFYGGSVFGQGASLAVTNSLFERVTTALSIWDSGASATYRNCLFYGGELELFVDDPVANLKDNFFDKTVISDLGNTTHGYNGYIYLHSRLTPTNINDRVLTSLAYQSGTLGRFYLPTGSALINNGSRLASAAGLYHYCTTANQTKEGTSQVDISYHYVAVNGSGHPIDTDGDGLADYLEDSNGNGTVNSGETHWQDANDRGLSVLITQPKKHANIP